MIWWWMLPRNWWCQHPPRICRTSAAHTGLFFHPRVSEVCRRGESGIWMLKYEDDDIDWYLTWQNNSRSWRSELDTFNNTSLRLSTCHHYLLLCLCLPLCWFHLLKILNISITATIILVTVGCCDAGQVDVNIHIVNISTLKSEGKVQNSSNLASSDRGNCEVWASIIILMSAWSTVGVIASDGFWIKRSHIHTN